MKDAENEANSLDSRFDLAYGAVHALCLAALRHHGFRPSKRYIVFQVLPDTLGLGPEVWRVLSKCHDMRNRTEYEGVLDVDDRLVSDLIGACGKVSGSAANKLRLARCGCATRACGRAEINLHSYATSLRTCRARTSLIRV